MKAVTKIKTIIEGQGKTTLLIRSASFTKDWRLFLDPSYPCILLIEGSEDLIQGGSSFLVATEFNLFAVNTTAYEFQTEENDAIVEQQRLEALDCVKILRSAVGVTRCEILAMGDVYDGGVGDLLTGVRLTLKVTMNDAISSCGGYIQRSLDIKENGSFSVTGYDIANVDVHAPAELRPLNVTPTTEEQVIEPTPDIEGFSPVTVAPVTASIDPNIQAENIKSGVSILGVAGTMEPKPDGDEITFYDIADISVQGPTFVTDTKATYIEASAFASNKLVYGINMTAVTSTGSNPIQSAYMQFVILPSLTAIAYRGFMSCTNLRKIVVGTVTSIGTQWSSTWESLRHFEVGQDTDINLDIRSWTATNVIAEGQDAIDELNYNIATYLADRVKDNSGGGPTRTITFGTALYNVLTADTIAAFTDKGWSVAYA